MSAAGWAERWRGWPGRASRGGTASSSVPGSGCAYTPDLWTTGSLCLCSERKEEREEDRRRWRVREGWRGHSETDERDVIESAIGGPPQKKHITNTAQHTDLSQQVQSPNTSSKYRRRCAGFLFTKPPVHTARLHSHRDKDLEKNDSLGISPLTH